MAEVLLFHHAQGRTAGVEAIAEAWRKDGHTVHVPDMYEGRTFASLDDGMEYVRETGFLTVGERGVRAAEDLPAGLVYAGISLGAMPAQRLAQTRAGAAGALLISGCVPVQEFGPAWPAEVPVEFHAKEDDPFYKEDEEAAHALVAEAPRGELFLYPGGEHLFMDAGLASYDKAAADLLLSRTSAFLRSVTPV